MLEIQSQAKNSGEKGEGVKRVLAFILPIWLLLHDSTREWKTYQNWEENGAK